MNFVFISPNFPESYRWFCIRLRENGVNVLGVGDARYEELHPDLRAALTEYYKVDSLADYDQMVRALGHFTGEYGKLDWVESNNEFWLELDAALRTDFNITTGLKSDEIVKYKSKSLMKEYFKAAGVPAARFLKLTTLEAALAFTAETGYPVVVKPDSGVGATATYKLSSDDEVRAFFRELPAEPYLMEEFVPGVVTTYDGVCNSKGEVLFAASHISPDSIMDMVNEGVPCCYYVDRQIPPEVEKAGRAVLKAFGASRRFFHLELFRLTADKAGLGRAGDIVALEVNMRPCGGFTPDMINFSRSTNVYKIWADMVAFGGTDMPVGEHFYCAYAGRRDGKPFLYSHEQIMQKYQGHMRMVDRIPDALADAMGNQMYVATFSTEEEMNQFYQDVLACNG